MCLIQPLKFRALKTGCFKMPRLQTPRLQTGVFQTVITVAPGLRKKSKFSVLRRSSKSTEKKSKAVEMF